MIRSTALLVLLLTLQMSSSCFAQALETPTGTVILTMSGAIDADNTQHAARQGTDQDNSVTFDLPMIEKIGMTRITTETPWTSGLVAFEGVLVRDLLSSAKAKGASVRATALNDYSVDIPIEDFLAHDVILATRIDGKVLRVRDNGPLWVIYPWTDESSLKRPFYFARSIWQLHSLTVNK